jgi:hypothetical protein
MHATRQTQGENRKIEDSSHLKQQLAVVIDSTVVGSELVVYPCGHAPGLKTTFCVPRPA